MAEVELRDGGSLYYEVHGEGEPVIFLNGIMMNVMSWVDLAPALTSKIRLILVDFRDQGRSSSPPEGYDIDLHASDLAELIEALDVGPVHLMGLSYGGQVALRYLVKHGSGRVKSLILANVVHRISNHLRAVGQAWETAAARKDGAEFFRLAIPFVYSSSFYERSAELLAGRLMLFEKLLTEEWFDALVRLSRATATYEVTLDELGALEAPTLLIGADHDLIAPLPTLDQMYEAIPSCEMLVLRDAGHGAFLERKEEFVTAVLGFVTKHS